MAGDGDGDGGGGGGGSGDGEKMRRAVSFLVLVIQRPLCALPPSSAFSKSVV